MTARAQRDVLAATGRAQRDVLAAIARHTDPPLSAREIAEALGGPEFRPQHDTENVARTVRRLHRKGLVRPLGRNAVNARTWALTAAGREALEGEEAAA